MYPKRMKKADIYLIKEDVGHVVTELHEARLIEKIDLSVKGKTPSETPFSGIRTTIERNLDFLEEMEDESKGLLSFLNPSRIEPMRISSADIEKKASEFAEETEADIDPIRESIGRIREQISKIEDLGERISQLSGLPLDLHTLRSVNRSTIRVGLTRNYQELSRKINEAGGVTEGSLLDKKERLHSVMIIYTTGNKEKIEEILGGRIFTEIGLDVEEIRSFLKGQGMREELMHRPLAELLPEFDRLIESNRVRIEEKRKEGRDLAKRYLPELRAYSEALRIENDKIRFERELTETRYSAVITGWMEADRENELRRMIERCCGSRYHLELRSPDSEQIEENKVPTKLRNNKLGSLFESMTNTFSPPRYNEIDPSFWISIPFILFFALMLGDAGYGLVILVLSIFVYRKARSSRFIHQVSLMGIMIGITTVLAGIWMGTFFGDLIQRVILNDPERHLYSLTLLGYHLPYDSLRDPMQLFQISIWLGLLQLNIGIILLGIDRLIKKQYWGFFKGSFAWFILQAGALILFGGMIIGWWELTPPLTFVGLGFFVSGSVLLAFEGGAMFLFDMEGYLGDVISYTRILALGLSTFGLAMAFNIIAAMINDISVIMIPVTVVILIVLHIFNLALQSLGSGVHSLRLQFVEFFGRFYKGGGHLFEPFGTERTYTRPVPDDIRRGGG